MCVSCGCVLSVREMVLYVLCVVEFVTYGLLLVVCGGRFVVWCVVDGMRCEIRELRDFSSRRNTPCWGLVTENNNLTSCAM